jgi:hypothetical protein
MRKYYTEKVDVATNMKKNLRSFTVRENFLVYVDELVARDFDP